MVTRTSARLDLQPVNPGEVAVTNAGRVAPRNTSGVFDNQIATKYPDLTAVPSGQLDPISSALFNVGSKITEQLIQRQQQDAYLNGALAVGAGIAEDEIEANIFTRQWAQAGYRDTIGRLALADHEAQVAKDMVKLQEQSPQQMAQYLKQQRAALSPTLDRMSRQGREQVFTQLLTSERANLAAHSKAHQTFIGAQLIKSLQGGISPQIGRMAATGGPADPAYAPARDALFTWMYANVSKNPNLTQDAKETLYKDALGSAMAQGDTGLYEAVRQAETPDGNTLFDTFSFDTQQKLAEQYYSTQTKHTARVAAEWWSNEAALKEAQARGEPIDMNQVYSHYAQASQLRTITPATVVSSIASFAKSFKTTQEEGNLAQAATMGDTATIAALGKTPGEAAKAAIQNGFKTQVRDPNTGELRPPTAGEVMLSSLDAGIGGGLGELTKAATKLLEPSLNVLMKADKAGEAYPTADNNVQMLGAWFSRYDAAKATGSRQTQLNMIADMGEAQREWLLTYEQVKREAGGPESISDLDAVNRTREIIRSRGDSPDAAAAMDNRQEKQTREALDGFYDQGNFMRLLSYTGSVITGDETVANRNLKKYNGWFTNEVLLAEGRSRTTLAIEEEARNLRRTHVGWDGELIKDMAVGNIQRRTVNTNFGPIIHPRGTNLQAAYGTPLVADPGLIGKAVTNLLEESGLKNGDGVSFDYEGGLLTYRNIDPETGQPTGVGTLESKDVGQEVIRIVKEQDAEAVKEYGSGVERSDPGGSGASVRFNGRNTAGVSASTALKVRNNLVDFEHIRAKPYEDTLGNTTVGVGLQNKAFYPKDDDFNPDGTLKRGVQDALFYKASNAALNTATKLIHDYALTSGSEPLVELLASLAYQGQGRAKPLYDELAVGTVDSAVKALYNTTAYKVSGQERKDWYESKVRAYFK